MNSQLCDDFYWREFARALRAAAGLAAVLAAFGGAALTLPASASAPSCHPSLVKALVA
jgi:hypothetical protein